MFWHIAKAMALCVTKRVSQSIRTEICQTGAHTYAPSCWTNTIMAVQM